MDRLEDRGNNIRLLLLLLLFLLLLITTTIKKQTRIYKLPLVQGKLS